LLIYLLPRSTSLRLFRSGYPPETEKMSVSVNHDGLSLQRVNFKSNKNYGHLKLIGARAFGMVA
jgi:hypothetical protein